MKAGDRLPSESEFEDMFDVSRSTIREAMKLLKAENIVEIERGRGTFISSKTGIVNDPLGLEFVDKSNLVESLLEARLIIEPPIAFLAAERATDEDISVLADIIREMMTKERQATDTAELDMEFHTQIAKCTKNNILHRVVPIINESILRGHNQTYDDNKSLEKAIKSHVNIFDSIRDHEPSTARYEAERHIRQTLDDIKQNKKMEVKL